MTNIPQRLAGVGVLIAATVLYDANDASMLQRLLIPGAMALGAWLVVQNFAAVLIAVTALTAIRTDFASDSWLASRAYPGIALLGGCGLGAIGLARFRARIAATREARWSQRNARRETQHHQPR